ncbi:MAG: glycosyltransferase [Planctomycetota bacterium]|jgi:glycosyltransferase involved in cell wall biosynthesis|nr:glycosyltransferase [Planctomycetota bacterium]MDP6763323.1 glycosyltransferase [Planctomycetota bacterium]MDP6989457.1 glycosyltransferase [Planctomycetota bacterium]
MRILLVSHRFPPRHTAGTEVYTADLAAGLLERGHEVCVFAVEKDISREHLSVVEREHAGVAVFELVNNLHYDAFEQTWSYPPAEAAFAAVLERVRPQVVHFQHLMYLSAGCLERAARGAAVAFTLHDYWLTCPRRGQRVHADGSLCEQVDLDRCAGCTLGSPFAFTPLERRVAGWVAAVRRWTGLDLGPAARRAGGLWRRREAGRATLGDPQPDGEARTERRSLLEERRATLLDAGLCRVDRFLSPSRFLRERLVEWGLPAERIDHLATGADLGLFGTGARPPKGPRLRVAFFGTLIRLKGPHLLLQAWGLLEGRLRERAVLELYGSDRHEPAYQARLATQAAEVGAHLRGEVERTEVAERLRSTDLVVVPSLWFENAPLVILEAFAARTPLLVSDLGGMAELVEPGVGGEHFRMGDPRDLAEKLARFIEAPQLLDALGAAPPPVPSRAEHVDALVALYEELRARRTREESP